MRRRAVFRFKPRLPPLEKSELLKQLNIDRKEFQSPGGKVSWLPWMLLAAAVSFGAWWLFGRDVQVHVKTAAVVLENAGPASILDATGYVVARRQATVSAKITGKIEAIYIEEGRRVQEGEVLARLDPVDAKAQLALSQAQRDAARSQLEDLQVQLEQARRDWARLRDLAARKLVSAQAAEQGRVSVDSFKARLATQQLQLTVAEQGVRVAQVNLDNTIVRAPFSGVIVTKAAQPGEIVSPMSAGGGFTRTGIGTIVDMDSLEIEVDVNESFIGRVKAGQPVEARLNAYPDWAIPAEVIAIIPTADRTKATVKVRIALKQKDPRIVPDMGVRVAFLEEPQTPASKAPPSALVPAAAVLGEGDGSAVFVVNEGRAQRRSVTLGEAVGGSRRVLAGLRGGEQVVLSPGADLRDGQPVQVE